MNLQRESVVVIKRPHITAEEPTGVLDLPKRATYVEVPQPYEFDPRAIASQRTSPEFPRWITHMAVIELFAQQTKHDWLLLLENNVDLRTEDLTRIEAKPGLSLFNEGAYLIDRPTAKTIVEHSRMFYAPIHQVFADLEKLNLITIHRPFQLPLIHPLWFYDYIPFILCLIASLLLLYPLYCSIHSEQFVGFAEVLTAKEAPVRG